MSEWVPADEDEAEGWPPADALVGGDGPDEDQPDDDEPFREAT